MKKMYKDLLGEKGRTQMPNVLIAASECAPLAKTGGLADVVGTLPKALQKLGIDARVIIPYHRKIKEKYANQIEHMFYFYVCLGWRTQYAGIEKLVLDGVTIYLVDSEFYYGGDIYRGGEAEIEQYAFFQRAVLDCIPNLDFVPDVIHCNDWQTGLIPLLARSQYPGGMQENLKFLLTIHNIMYQGKCGYEYLYDLLGIDAKYNTPEFMELNGCVDFLKAGCVFADLINTVSPSYAQEICDPYYSEGLEGILNARSHELSGIVNGIDYDVFNPADDPCTVKGYSQRSMAGKKECKQYLQKSMGLDQRDDVPLVSMVTRMTEQKGFDLVICMIDELLQYNDMQFMLLGSGDANYEAFMRCAEDRYKGKLCSYIGYNDKLAHMIYAGSDFYLMPSRFEPCGISQMIAMRYGTLPIVRETGGLKDTVQPYNQYTGEGTGFSFANYNAHEMKETILQALGVYQDKAVMKKLVKNAMTADFSFDRSAEEYAKLYIGIL